LQRVLLLKNLLHVIEPFGSVYAFERENLGTVGLHRELNAGACGFSVHHDRAGAARAFSATELQSRETQVIAQEIAQQKTVGHYRAHFLSVHGDT
jgi:hypothetical protein